MTTFGKIKAIADGLGIQAYPDAYSGKDSERPTRWIAYNYSYIQGGDYADDGPQEAVETVQVHYFCPAKENFTGTIKKLEKQLLSYGFTFPATTQAGLEESESLRHVVLECDVEREE